MNYSCWFLLLGLEEMMILDDGSFWGIADPENLRFSEEQSCEIWKKFFG
jgi:hypothetical protein